ncbi:MAG: virion core protein (lumpy skin disease virus) [Deltaproteobacteria bacterium HGW-Deltaproteobacteria-19]|jgi:membrane protease subunit (stomatin/prohibitin family)|nr:MAG: virion core protein (lumpy skin disease virus) [Deltaproteobacteria bacterium HGW-Deltaproteobacteria-19]
MGTNNIVFLEVIEWFDDSGQELVHRIPQEGSGEIKWGAQLTVRESQAAVFFYNGKAVDALGPGRHTLKTMNIPILTKILSAPWGMTSPLRAEVYIANMKVFPNLKWGTRDPVAFRDSELGLIRLRAFGIFNIRILQPVLFINSLVGTKASFGTEDLEEYLNRVIVSRFNDYMGEQIDTIFNLPAKYDEMSAGLKQLLQEDLSQFGLGLLDLYINSITPPPEVQKAIDDKSKLGVFDDLNKLLKMKAAMALESAAANQGETGSALGMGMGFMMPAMFADAFRPGGTAGAGAAEAAPSCPGCRQPVPKGAKFCSFCGQPLLLYKKCASCGGDIPPQGRFCPGCGKPADEKPSMKKCGACGTENLPGSSFCNACGERI